MTCDVTAIYGQFDAFRRGRAGNKALLFALVVRSELTASVVVGNYSNAISDRARVHCPLNEALSTGNWKAPLDASNRTVSIWHTHPA